MNKWQPIETAPRNGKWILVTGFKTRKRGPVSHTCAIVGWFPVSVFKEESGHQWFYGTSSGEYVKEPTHWMELPDIPADIRKPANIKDYVEVVTLTRRTKRPSTEYLLKRKLRYSGTVKEPK